MATEAGLAWWEEQVVAKAQERLEREVLPSLKRLRELSEDPKAPPSLRKRAKARLVAAERQLESRKKEGE